MIRRRHNEITFECDGCGSTLDTWAEQWDEALECLKRENWISEKFAGEWQHMCSRCK